MIHKHGNFVAINWPAIVKLAGDDELLYVSNLSEWEKEINAGNSGYTESDLLIDSKGKVFELTPCGKNHVETRSKEQYLSVAEILGLVKAHAAQKGSCCVAKLYAPTISEAFKIVESLHKN